MPFLLNEDTALKSKLQGLAVHDATSGSAGRRVTVRYRSPEYEVADATFPLILLSHTRVSQDSERESRGYVNLHYAPEGFASWADMSDPTQSPYMAQMPVPLNIDYQVDVYTRKQNHLIQLIATLLGPTRLPHRFGYLEIPQDGTKRRLDVLGGPETVESQDELGKRLFSATWAIRISSEIFLSDIATLTPAQRVLLDLSDTTAPAGS